MGIFRGIQHALHDYINKEKGNKKRRFQMMKEKVRLELVGANPKNLSGESNKFWEGWTHGTNFLAHWGANGTDGQIRSWSFK